MKQKVNEYLKELERIQKPKIIKIAFLIDSLRRTGAQRVVLDICSHINKSKFDVYTIFWRKGGFYKEFKKVKDLKLIYLKNNTDKNTPLFMKPLILFRQQKELRKIVEKERFNIIHSHLFFPDIHNSLLKRKFKNIKTVSTKHDTNFYRKKWSYIIQYLFDSNMDKITTCSDSVRKLLRKQPMRR